MFNLRNLALLALAASGSSLQARAVAKSVSADEMAIATARKTILDLEHRLLQARVSTDTSIHRSNFSEEAVYIHSSGRMQHKTEVLTMVAERPWVSWSKSHQEIQIFGAGAVTHSILSVRLTDNRTETVRTTGVYVKQSATWVQVSWQSSSGRFEAPAAGRGN